MITKYYSIEKLMKYTGGKYQIVLGPRKEYTMKNEEYDKIVYDFIIHKMLKGTECIIYANKLMIDTIDGPLYYYKVTTIDTKGIARTYIRLLEKDVYVEVLP